MSKQNATVESVRQFWDVQPCGSETASAPGLTPDYFREIETFRYGLEPHILEVVPFASCKGKRVLEIGCGVGTDGARFASSDATYDAFDITSKALDYTRANFAWRGLQGRFTQGNAEELPYPESTFDVVYSHGVIHHIPDTEKVVAQIHRVLRPGGRAVVMVYHRHSYNYYGNILFLRRIGALILRLPGGVALTHYLTGENREILEQHRAAFVDRGWRYLRAQEFLSANTDGPGNPLSRVYSKSEAGVLFKNFKHVIVEVRYLNRRRLPLLGKFLPEKVHDWLSARWGWHLYIFAEK